MSDTLQPEARSTEVIWDCRYCGTVFTSDAARRECEAEDEEADRAARRRHSAG